MATVTGLTADAMQEIADASVTSGHVDVNGNLILTTHGGSSIDAGAVAATAKMVVADTPTLDLSMAGAGTPANPWSLSGDVKPLDASQISSGIFTADRLPYQTVPALLDPTYIGPGPAKVTFLSGGGLSSVAYEWEGRYDISGNRVVNMQYRGNTWVIAGHNFETALGGKLRLTLQNNWVTYNSKSALPANRWTEPRAQRLPSGIVILSGLIGFGTVTSGTVIANLPIGMRPDYELIFPVNNGEASRGLGIYANGDIYARGNWAAATYISLDGMAFPAAGVAAWTSIGAVGSGSAYVNGWADYGSASLGPARYWKDPYGFVWLGGLIKGGTTTGDNWPIVTLPAGYGSYAQSHIKVSSVDLHGFMSSHPTGLYWKSGGGSASWLSLNGVCIVTAEAKANNPWWYPASYGAMTNAWTVYAGFTDFAFVRRGDGLGMTMGLIKGGTAPAIKVAGLHGNIAPLGLAIMYAVSAQVYGRLDIYSSNWSVDDNRGQLFVQTGSAAWISMDNQMWMVGE